MAKQDSSDIEGDGFRPLRKLTTAASGLRRAVFQDFSVQYKFLISLATLVFAGYLHFQSAFPFYTVLAVTALMLVTEILNTSIEAICDKISPEYDPDIAYIKDTAAAAAIVAVLVWWVVVGYVAYQVFVS